MAVACFHMPQAGIAVERNRFTHLWGEPVALADDAGLIKALSDEASAAGIKTGQAASGAKAFCPQLITLPYDLEAYNQASECIWNLFAIESSFVEPISPELCYVELAGPKALEIARRLADELAARVRIPICVGLSKTKIAARQAALRGRDGDVLVIKPGSESDFLSSVDLSNLSDPSYLSRKEIEMLERLGIRTLGDVRKLPPQAFRQRFRSTAQRLARYALGEDGEQVKPNWPPRSIEHGIEFEDETEMECVVDTAIRDCARALGDRLVRKHEYARSVTMQVLFADGTRHDQTEKPALPVGGFKAIYAAALRLLHRTRVEQPIRGLRLRLSGLGGGSAVQLALLDEKITPSPNHPITLPHERANRLHAALRYLRGRYGPASIISLSLMRQAKRIDLWTYPLGRLLSEPIEVDTDEQGRPRSYSLRGRRREIIRIHDRWRETDWFWGALNEKTVYRVESDPGGVNELHRLGIEWRLEGAFD